jgi:hypothetical protein
MKKNYLYQNCVFFAKKLMTCEFLQWTKYVNMDLRRRKQQGRRRRNGKCYMF